MLFLVFEHWSGVWANGLRSAIGAAEDPFDRLYAAVDFLVGAADRHPEVPHLLYRESGNLDEQGLKMFKECELEQIGIVREVVDDAVRSGDLRPDANVELIATSIVFLTTAWALKGWLLRRSQKPRSYVDFVDEPACSRARGRRRAWPAARPGAAERAAEGAYVDRRVDRGHDGARSRRQGGEPCRTP